MKIEKNNYRLEFDGSKTLSISGKLAAMPEEYEEIEDYFEQLLEKLSADNTELLNLDIRNLAFMNSSGIKTLCVSLVMEADDIEGLHMKILCNNSFDWQKEAIPTFKDLMDNLEIVFE